jgi:hypothetical protein
MICGHVRIQLIGGRSFCFCERLEGGGLVQIGTWMPASKPSISVGATEVNRCTEFLRDVESACHNKPTSHPLLCPNNLGT